MVDCNKTIPLVLYDGDCGFCNLSVQFVLRNRKGVVHFAPLQSKTAAALVKSHGMTIRYDTIYYLKGNRLYDRSSAVLQLAKQLRGVYPLLMALYVVPKCLRDFVYDEIARRRQTICPPSCALPTPEERRFFLELDNN